MGGTDGGGGHREKVPAMGGTDGGCTDRGGARHRKVTATGDIDGGGTDGEGARHGKVAATGNTDGGRATEGGPIAARWVGLRGGGPRRRSRRTRPRPGWAVPAGRGGAPPRIEGRVARFATAAPVAGVPPAPRPRVVPLPAIRTETAADGRRRLVGGGLG